MKYIRILQEARPADPVGTIKRWPSRNNKPYIKTDEGWLPYPDGEDRSIEAPVQIPTLAPDKREKLPLMGEAQKAAVATAAAVAGTTVALTAIPRALARIKAAGESATKAASETNLQDWNEGLKAEALAATQAAFKEKGLGHTVATGKGSVHSVGGAMRAVGDVLGVDAPKSKLMHYTEPQMADVDPESVVHTPQYEEALSALQDKADFIPASFEDYLPTVLSTVGRTAIVVAGATGLAAVGMFAGLKAVQFISRAIIAKRKKARAASALGEATQSSVKMPEWFEGAVKNASARVQLMLMHKHSPRELKAALTDPGTRKRIARTVDAAVKSVVSNEVRKAMKRRGGAS